MRITFYILTLLFLKSCGNGQQQKQNVATKSDTTITATAAVDIKEKPQIKYTDSQLKNYLDSIGSLSSSLLADKVSFVEDSVFKSQLQTDKLISASDFIKLKCAIIKKTIDTSTAKTIFGKGENAEPALIDIVPIRSVAPGKREEHVRALFHGQKRLRRGDQAPPLPDGEARGAFIHADVPV